MTYADFFYEIKGKFMGVDVSDIKEHLAFQFNIEDNEAGGAFYVEVKNGELLVEPYEYHDRDAMFVCRPEILEKIADGEMDPVWAFTTQKLRVEGNFDKALKLKDIIEKKKKEMKKEAKEAKKEAKEAAKEAKKEAKEAKKEAVNEDKKEAVKEDKKETVKEDKKETAKEAVKEEKEDKKKTAGK